MSSAETDRCDRAERDRHTDRALAEARGGRDRLRDLADQEVPPSHGDKSRDLPNTSPGGRR
jgi:hypothetical protein